MEKGCKNCGETPQLQGNPSNLTALYTQIVQIFPAGIQQFPVPVVFMVKTFAVYSTNSQVHVQFRFYFIKLSLLGSNNTWHIIHLLKLFKCHSLNITIVTRDNSTPQNSCCQPGLVTITDSFNLGWTAMFQVQTNGKTTDFSFQYVFLTIFFSKIPAIVSLDSR